MIDWREGLNDSMTELEWEWWATGSDESAVCRGSAWRDDGCNTTIINNLETKEDVECVNE